MKLQIAFWLMTVCLFTAAFGARAAVGEDPRQSDAHSQILFTTLHDAWRSNQVGYVARRQVIRAAASREALVKFAQDTLQKGGEDGSRLVFAAEVLTERPRRDSIESLLSAATSELVSRKARYAALSALETIAGNDYRPPQRDESSDQNPTLDAEIKAVKEWLVTHDPQPDGREADQIARVIHGCVDQIATQIQTSRSFDENQFEVVGDCIQINLDLFTQAAIAGQAAPFLVSHLTQLQSLPAAKPADKLDRAIGRLQYQALSALQNYIGPINGMSDNLTKRSETEPIVTALIEQWKTTKDKCVTEQRMERLAIAGYRTTVDQSGSIIGLELLRAVQSGTPAECKSAADLLCSLGICDGTVPMRDESTKFDVLIADALVRSEVVAEASAAMLRGRFPSWDKATKSWSVTTDR